MRVCCHKEHEDDGAVRQVQPEHLPSNIPRGMLMCAILNYVSDEISVLAGAATLCMRFCDKRARVLARSNKYKRIKNAASLVFQRKGFALQVYVAWTTDPSQILAHTHFNFAELGLYMDVMHASYY